MQNGINKKMFEDARRLSMSFAHVTESVNVT